jgi:hypothetical protein
MDSVTTSMKKYYIVNFVERKPFINFPTKRFAL